MTIRREAHHEHRLVPLPGFCDPSGDEVLGRSPGARRDPFTPLAKPLRECVIALVSTAGIARHDDRPFDQEHERRDPWWGDPSFRVLPIGTTEQDVRLYHMHIDPRFGQADLDVVLPMRRLTELAAEGIVGRPAPRHYSMMGFILDPTVLVEETAPAMADRMRADEVDAVVLVPA